MRQHLFMFGLLGLLAWAAGCGSGNTAHSERTAATAASRPQSTDRAAQTRQVTLSITGMSGPSGGTARVRKALASLPWVREVQVDFGQRQATVTALASQYDSGALIEVLKKEGFQAKVMQGGSS